MDLCDWAQSAEAIVTNLSAGIFDVMARVWIGFEQ
jgi:hypothetical protein